MLRIKIKGKEYPCEMSMGALMKYRKETGKDVIDLDHDSLEDQMMLPYCCVSCACQAEGVEFGMDFETFCNSITPRDLTRWNEALIAEQGPLEKKA